VSRDTLQSHPGTHPGDVIGDMGPWFHNVHLPDGRQTAPDHPLGDYPGYKWKALEAHFPDRLDGRTVLDIGCNAGYFSVELARLGARVTAIDHDPHYLRQAAWVRDAFGLGNRMHVREGDVYGLAVTAERFDIVLFLGVFYHLRHPLLGLDLAAAACSDMLLVQSLAKAGASGSAGGEGDPGFLGRDRLRDDGWPSMSFVEHELAGDPTNWWVPNPSGLHAMVRSAGYDVTGHAADILVCRRGSGADAAAARCKQLIEQVQYVR
jgi:tRNA (mo5U34)-methyltransferase